MVKRIVVTWTFPDDDYPHTDFIRSLLDRNDSENLSGFIVGAGASTIELEEEHDLVEE